MATFEKESIFNLENAIEYTNGGVISKQVTKKKQRWNLDFILV